MITTTYFNIISPDEEKHFLNGEEIEVNEQGMFLYNLNLTKEKNLVVINAKSDRGNKRIVRSFIVNE